MRTDLLVVHAHAVEDVADVVRALVAVGQTTVGRAVLDVAVLAAGAPRHIGAAEFLNRDNTGESLREERSKASVSKLCSARAVSEKGRTQRSE